MNIVHSLPVTRQCLWLAMNAVSSQLETGLSVRSHVSPLGQVSHDWIGDGCGHVGKTLPLAGTQTMLSKEAGSCDGPVRSERNGAEGGSCFVTSPFTARLFVCGSKGRRRYSSLVAQQRVLFEFPFFKCQLFVPHMIGRHLSFRLVDVVVSHEVICELICQTCDQ